uniref:Uncharacterized protein n=1 Tax=Rhizophora mucronata TaxID=61149 RepID=A0A2P2NE50_RHIMU
MQDRETCKHKCRGTKTRRIGTHTLTNNSRHAAK